MGQRERRDPFHDASWVHYFTQPRIPEGTVHLIIGASLVRDLTRIQAHWQVGILSFSGAATPQLLASLEMLEMGKVYTVTLMMGTNDVSRGESRNMMRLLGKVSCILEELRIYLDPNVLTICTVLYNMMADQNAMNMNERADQARKLQESAAKCDQIKSEIERLQRKQQELASGTERQVKTSTESLMTRSRPDSRMEVDEIARSVGRFNLDRVAQEQMKEGLAHGRHQNPSQP